MTWEVASAIIGVVALVLEWLRARGADHRVWNKLTQTLGWASPSLRSALIQCSPDHTRLPVQDEMG